MIKRFFRAVSPKPQPLRWRLVSKRHRGKTGNTMQDELVMSVPGESLSIPRFAAVADGHGEGKSGRVAAGLAVKMFARALREAYNDGWHWPTSWGAPGKYHEPLNSRILRRAFSLAHVAIDRISKVDQSLNAMGSTLLGIILEGQHLTYAHVGNSRLYHLGKSGLTQVTKDHTQQPVEFQTMILTPEMLTNPKPAKLIKSVGGDQMEPDLGTLKVEAGDMFLLCTEGIHDELSVEQITKILSGTQTLETKRDQLVEAALDAGGKRNIALILGEVF